MKLYVSKERENKPISLTFLFTVSYFYEKVHLFHHIRNKYLKIGKSNSGICFRTGKI